MSTFLFPGVQLASGSPTKQDVTGHYTIQSLHLCDPSLLWGLRGHSAGNRDYQEFRKVLTQTARYSEWKVCHLSLKEVVTPFVHITSQFLVLSEMGQPEGGDFHSLRTKEALMIKKDQAWPGHPT